jgi:spoIIIJ-associated protein
MHSSDDFENEIEAQANDESEGEAGNSIATEDGRSSEEEAGVTPSTVSEEELDRIADSAIAALRNILGYFDAGDAGIDEYEGDDGELILDVIGDNLAVLIGHYGKTLDSLQFIVSAIVSKEIGYRYPIVVDVEGYRNRRRQKLEGIARSSAARCIRSGAPVSLKPMTPYERRIVHIVLREDSRIITESEGEEPNRYIVVKPV